MCLVVFGLNMHPEMPLVLLANRDEYYARPTARAQPFSDMPGIFGGRDLEKGGTWLAVNAAGRFAAVTNFRNPQAQRSGQSRGALILEALQPHASLSASDWAWAESIPRSLYPSFNLLLGDEREILYAQDASADVQRISTGIHGLSNDRLDTQWPKVRRGCAGLQRLLAAPVLDMEAAYAILADRTLAPDAELPHTGVTQALERALSPAFIAIPGYGTRASTILVIYRDGRRRFAERTFGEGGDPESAATVDVWLPPASR